MELVRLACQMPDDRERSLAVWDSVELARELVREGVVTAISPQTVQRILSHHKLKPWRSHVWLRQRTPRDADFVARTKAICDLYTRPLEAHEVVLSTKKAPRPVPALSLPQGPRRARASSAGRLRGPDPRDPAVLPSPSPLCLHFPSLFHSRLYVLSADYRRRGFGQAGPCPSCGFVYAFDGLRCTHCKSR